MSSRIKKSWQVLRSIESSDRVYCVDIFLREDHSFGFEEFRQDIDDGGLWTGINYYSTGRYQSEGEALNQAIRHVLWLAASLESERL